MRFLSFFLALALPLSAQVDSSLSQQLLQVVQGMENHPEFKKPVRMGLVIYDLQKRKLLFANRADEQFIPASNMKLVTTAGALDLLGRNYQFTTRAWLQGKDILLLAGGDPAWGRLVAGRSPDQIVASLAAALNQAGVKEITGSLVVDANFFDQCWVHGDWPGKQLHNDYCAPVGGLNLASGCAHVIVKSPRRAGARPLVSLWPAGIPLRIKNTARVVLRGRTGLLVSRVGGDLIKVGGKASPGSQRFQVTIANPVAYTAHWLAAALGKHGLAPTGGVKVTSFPVPGGKPVWTFQTPLTMVLPVVNKQSHNQMAEHIFKTLGREKKGTGSWPASGKVLIAWLQGLGLSGDQLKIRDGCGLSKHNKLTPRAVAGVLLWAHRSKSATLFRNTLARGGIDGTLRKRLNGPLVKGKVRGKTGWVAGASCLSGYLNTSKRNFVFSILIDYPYRAGLNQFCKKSQDRICTVLATWAKKTETAHE